MKREGIEGLSWPNVHRLRLQCIQQFNLPVAGNRGQRIVARVDHEAAPLPVEDAVENIPCAKGRHLARKGRLRIEPLEDGHVGVGHVVVGVNAGVGNTRQRLVVAGIAEVQPVDHLRLRTQVAIAKDLPLAGNRAPQERHQRLAPLLRSLSANRVFRHLRCAHPAHPATLALES